MQIKSCILITPLTKQLNKTAWFNNDDDDDDNNNNNNLVPAIPVLGITEQSQVLTFNNIISF
jgi:hypothetical protein